MKNCYDCNHCEVCRWINEYKDKDVCDFYEQGKNREPKGMNECRKCPVKKKCGYKYREHNRVPRGRDCLLNKKQEYDIEEIKAEIENYMKNEGFGSGWIEDIKEIINKCTKGE